MNSLTVMEHAILDFIQQTMRSPLFDRIWPVITHMGDLGAVWIILSLVLLIHHKTRKLGLICIISLICSLLLTNILLKNLVARTRPFYLVDINLLIRAPGEHSFPSGHASSSFAVAFVLWKERARIGRLEIYRLGMILASLIAFSRLYLYVHYPTDVLAGMLVGYVCSLIAFRIGPAISKRYDNIFGPTTEQ